MFKNEYLLDIDLKFVPSFTSPRFRRGDTALLKFRIHDNGIAFDTTQFDKAEVTIEMPSKVKLVDLAKKEKVDGANLIVFQFAPLHMVEAGIYTVYLTLIKGDDRVSPTPIKVRFYDNLSQEDLSFISIIDDLKKEIDAFQLKLTQGINLSEISAPNGVASLDSDKKISESQTPDFLKNHLASYARSDEGVHDIKISSNGLAMVKDKDGVWNNVIFSDKPISEGTLPTHTS
ncbi:hypothetical protein ACZ11_13595 [Lysinibacillus xylanilyticus]|uniref:BppU N-terminal domain-containing protein n=1 Tax=Lysinibacillus xylanilyticus TaxID=582475 RepID=A0A0K9FG35_9BACI|nr:hypothetical protein [Lysinibacillus xylanilyticus]KMY33096.1 hypothetical protein ACZ11_13595 [Lysinibacillus xylanilyticus]